MPPASSRPTIASSSTATAASAMRSSVAAADADQDGALTPLGRQAGGGQPDDDRVVAGQHQVDHDDLQEGGDRGLCEEVVHRVLVQHRRRGLTPAPLAPK